MQFGNDWPGVFIRGDNAAHYAQALDELLLNSLDSNLHLQLTPLLKTLRSAMIPTTNVDKLKDYKECK